MYLLHKSILGTCDSADRLSRLLRVCIEDLLHSFGDYFLAQASVFVINMNEDGGRNGSKRWHRYGVIKG